MGGEEKLLNTDETIVIRNAEENALHTEGTTLKLRIYVLAS